MGNFLITLFLLAGSNSSVFCPQNSKGTLDEALRRGESITVNITELGRILAVVALNDSIVTKRSFIKSDVAG